MPALKKCVFCKTSDSSVLLGDQYNCHEYKVHYYCLLLSEKATQSGNDDEGVLGFTLADIKTELMRCKNIKCIYCKKNGASLKCRKCYRTYHLPCGLKRGISYQFVNEFPTFCPAHTKKSKMKKLKDKTCMICLFHFSSYSKDRIIPSNCCKKKNMHVECAQRYADNAGYELKCPNCQNRDEFRSGLLKSGVFVPLRDALWETNESFAYLTEETLECELENCVAETRSLDRDNTLWELLTCIRCGASAAHRACAAILLTEANTYKCLSCISVVPEIQTVTLPKEEMEMKNEIEQARPSGARPCGAYNCLNEIGRYFTDDNKWRPIYCDHCKWFMIHFACNGDKTTWSCMNMNGHMSDSTHYSLRMSSSSESSDKENQSIEGSSNQPKTHNSSLGLRVNNDVV